MVKEHNPQGEVSLRGLAVVIVKNATKDMTTANLTGTDGDGRRNRNLLVDALVRTRCVVVNDELTHDTSQMGLVDDQQFVQTCSVS
jgi:hypothetical protein